MSLKIHSYPQNPRVFKALIAGKYNDVAIEYPQDFAMGTANKTPEFLKLNPFGKVPTLETPEGGIFESNAIARYVARSGKNVIYGKNVFEASQIDSWLDFCATTLEPAVMQWIAPILGYLPYNKKVEQEAKEKVLSNLQVVNKYLETRTFLVGERISLADIVMTCVLLLPYKMVFEPSVRAPFTHINRWFNTCINQPNFKAVLGEVTLCVKAAEPKKEAPKKAEEKPAAPKKEEKPAAEEEEEESYEEKPKAKNPLDLLPKSKLNLEEWKRFYSNNDTRSAAIPWFWEHYDPEGYCMYFMDYKYNDELSVPFKTSNLIGGFYQRLEKLHKYAFGSTLIVGEESKHAITGVWLFRGTDIPAEMKECDDFELYEWRKADTNDAATRELINDYFAWDKPIAGKAVIDGKIFK
eukprot:GEZU01032652.1.p1 GENE.GEZU01032652.1~~GEZU01032652.1.p1  ORF type:complete len:425 (-),score=222.10 GEZU01032652.1:670-1896(-)